MASESADRTPIRSGLWRYLDLRWRLTRVLGSLARRFFPVIRFRNTVYVLRAEDVRSVLARPEDFSVAIFEMRMTATMGLTFLGMDPSGQYAKQYVGESGALRAALDVPDPQPRGFDRSEGPGGVGRLTWVRRFSAELSRKRVEDALKTRGEIDVVSDLADFVPLDFARVFFGIPEPDPSRPEILHWLKIVSYYLFAPAATAWAVPAKRAGLSIAEHFRRLVKARHDDIMAGRETPDDVLGRLIAAQGQPGSLGDEAIARTLGFISGAMMPTSWLFIYVVDRLLRIRRAERERLHRLARAGDEAGVRAYVIEAARFFPFPFFILRYAEREADIGGRRVSRGSVVNLVIASATTDSRAIRHAGCFDAGRPESEYMLFGHGTHLCQGKDIAEELMTQMALALFSRQNLRRVRGLRGYVSKGPKGVIPEGFYPRSLILTADG
jgi:cytochrome P450